ncbi:hypothetical protein [uncultured Deinococcus sp.]|uniref:hypothetical protein n=1 Tax=uncultured Deinococcus sp. TaxID=158789 RepID=UPI0025FDB436|nr:hypothetical protein [uncultured Deinococcus sp.]
MEHYPAYDWNKAWDDEGSLVLAFLTSRIPEIHLRRAWPMAQLQAFIGNALGGKASRGKKVDDSRSFKPQDFMPFYARPAWLAEMDDQIEPHHCVLIAEALENGDLRKCSWVLHLIDAYDSLERVREVGERILEQEGEGGEG